MYTPIAAQAAAQAVSSAATSDATTLAAHVSSSPGRLAYAAYAPLDQSHAANQAAVARVLCNSEFALECDVRDAGVTDWTLLSVRK